MSYRSLISGVLGVAFLAGSAFAQTTVGQPVKPYVFDADLSTLPKDTGVHPPAPSKALNPAFPAVPAKPTGPPDPLRGKTAPAPGQIGAAPAQFTAPNPNFDTDQPGDGPPDANGAVGPNHYIAIVNFTYEIFDKNGNSLAGPNNPATFWSGAPANDPCRNQRGDPYVLYDHLADRWLITYFANNPAAITVKNPDPLQYQCIAISKGANPVTGGWYAYTYFLGVSNDYPKLAIWPDGYYMISQRGYDGTASLDAWVFDRTNMLAGNAGTFQHPSGFPAEHDVIALPSDLTGPVPPAGSPNFYARPYDGNLYSDGSPRIEIFEFHTDWAVPGNTKFSLVQTITPATFRSDICAGANLNQDCIPQPGTTSTLDALSIWPMGPLQYRNFGDHETLLFSHAVNSDGKGLVGIRWHELRRSPPGSGTWSLFQEGTYSPADNVHRWTSSIGMDQAGNIALGYNVSSGTVYPGLRLVGRLASDAAGQMTSGEIDLADGGSSITCRDKNNNIVACRWGDYSALRVDPADGCTFWYTTEYEPAGGQQTRVSAVKMTACSTLPPVISKLFTPASIPLNGNTTLTFTITNPDAGNYLAGVGFTDTLPSGLIVTGSSGACDAGTIGAAIGSGFISLTGATLPPNGSCTFSVTIKGTTAGVKLNVTGNVTSTAGNGNTASATLQVIAPPVISKAFTPNKVIPGGTTTLTLSILNPNSFVGLTGVAFTDTLPGSVVVASPSNLTNTCGGTASTTANSVSLLNGAIAASGTCTVTVRVTGVTEGIFLNSVQVTSTNGGTGNTASATLFVATPPNLSKTFGELSIGVGNTTSLTFTLSNPNHIVTLTGLQFSDTLPTGLIVATPNGITGTCGGGTIAAVPGSNLITLASATLAAQASCTFSVNVTSNGAAQGYVTNTTSTITSNEALDGTAASAKLFIGDPFQITYTANLSIGDSVINITNSGASGAALQSGTTASIVGAICANVYAFTPDEQLVSCCSCPVTPNGLVSLSAKGDLASNTLTPAVPSALVVKVIATLPVGGSCTNSAAALTTNLLANGLKSYGSTIHATPDASYGVTETRFLPGTLSAGEASRLGSLCNFILANGSGFGVCRSCRLGGLGSDRQ